jgi:hypothetical protein
MSVTVDTRALSRLAVQLRASAPEAWLAYRKSVRAVAEVVMRDAQGRVAYSDRIPGSMKIRTSGRGNVSIVAGGANAPDAPAIENKGKGFVRHPVFGDKNVWTSKNSHPAFLAPALDAHREEVAEVVGRAVTDAIDAMLGGDL